MSEEIYSEKTGVQQPALSLLQALGYTYLSPAECERQRGSRYRVLLKGILKEKLRQLNRYRSGNGEREFSDANLERAIEDLDKPTNGGLIQDGRHIYDLLTEGCSLSEINEHGSPKSFNFRYIDWENPQNNLFHVTEEFAVESNDGGNNARPDIVLFINGIPFAVIECKAPSISEEAAVEQHLRNQENDWIPQLYKYAQILIATNKNSVKYGTLRTGKKYWNVWKEEDHEFLKKTLDEAAGGRTPSCQDRTFVSLFHKSRVTELIRYFILFDRQIKKICRYHQFFAVRDIMKTITADSGPHRRGGLVWHTQGSGKSLTMVMLARCILYSPMLNHPRVVIVTDRRELDSQIADTFRNTRMNPERAANGRMLIKLLNENRADVVTTIINKFNTVDRSKTQNLSKDIFVLVDESHRTHYGEMAAKMRTALPNACYIGFTGTPLMKQEKNTMTKFGGLIHKYTIKDGVDDKAIVPLIYEGRFVEQTVDEANIDLWFEETTKRLTQAQKDDLMRKWSSIQRLSSTDARIRRIALDISRHYSENIKPTGFRAMVATNYKRDAVRYLNCFEAIGDLECAVIISPPDMRESTDDKDESDDANVIRFWKKMCEQYSTPEEYEKRLKDRFRDGEIDLLIVCSKLLTGFDAPLCQVLYIDKELKDHGLLQAIARTNRLCDGKDFGLIVDYRGLIQKLDAAMDLYSGAGLENFEGGDLKGVAVDIVSAIGSVRQAYAQLKELFNEFDPMNENDSERTELFLEDEKRRIDFYNALCAFGRALHLFLNSDKLYKQIPREELALYKKAFIFYSKVRRSVRIRYRDAVDNREYEPLMQNLLDRHLSVGTLKQITEPVDILNREAFEKELEELGSLRAKADAIAHALSESISAKYDENPAYYDSFSQRIKTALREYREKLLSDADYLAKLRTIADDYRTGRGTLTYPDSIGNDPHAQAFYGVLRPVFDEAAEVRENAISYEATAEIAKEMKEIIETHSRVDWTHNRDIHNRIAQDIDDYFYRYSRESGIPFDMKTVDKVIENVKTVAMRRFRK